MKNPSIHIFIAFILFFGLVAILPKQENNDATRDEETGPGHPGWMEQWSEMKTLGTGEIDRKLISNIRDNQRVRFRRGSGNLADVNEIGPFNVGGRTRALVIDHSNPNHIIAGGVSGGLWQTFDRGDSWSPIDDFGANLSVSYITQSPFDSDIYYYSTGEPSGNSAGIPGDGIYKSEDGGETFYKLPASSTSEFDYSWRVVHSMVDSHTIYVGTRSDGLYRSTNGGDSFQLIFNSGSRDVTDIEVFADSSVIVGVEGRGIFYSPTGDSATFELRETGLPSSGFRRIELAYPDSFPNTIYSTFVRSDNDGITGVYRSDDHGATWDSIGNPMNFDIRMNFPWYCLTLEIKPDNPDYIVIGGVEMGFSGNAGKTWNHTTPSHADNHIVKFSPVDANEFYVGNDGGVYRYHTNDAQVRRDDLNNGYNVTQFYTGAFFPEGTDVYGGTQDNGTRSTKNGAGDFDHIFGGDGAFTQINQQVPSVAYVSWQRGHIYATYSAHLRNPDFDNIMNELDGDDDGDIDEGAWFIHPFETNRKDGFQLYFPTRQRLWMSHTGGDSWQPLLKAINYAGTPYAVGVSNDKYPSIYLGGTDGLFFRIDSAYFPSQRSFKNLSGKVPDSITDHFIGNITVSPQTDSVVYVALTNYSSLPRIYKVIKAKSTEPEWIPIHNNLPKGLPVNWIEVSPLTDSVLVAATDFGLYTSIDAGNSWQLEPEIPLVSIHQVRLRHKDGKLFVFTHGRGIFEAQLPGNYFTGIDLPEEDLKRELTIYPNPVKEKFRVKWPSEKIRLPITIYDLNGRVIKQQLMEEHEAVSVNDLSSGQYLVELSDGNKSFISRMIKQ